MVAQKDVRAVSKHSLPDQNQQDTLKIAYTGLTVVRVTQKQKALNWVVLNCRVPVHSRILKQATVNNFPVGVRWIGGLI